MASGVGPFPTVILCQRFPGNNKDVLGLGERLMKEEHLASLEGPDGIPQDQKLASCHAFLDHRNITNTLVSTQLVNSEDDDYHSATANTVQEAAKLIEAGFEYVCTHTDIMLFRKRK